MSETALADARQLIENHGPFTGARWKCRESGEEYFSVGACVLQPEQGAIVAYIRCEEFIAGPCIPLAMALGRFLDCFEKIPNA